MREWEEEVTHVRIESEEGDKPQIYSLYLVGKVLTNKTFNSFGFLEAMKRAMKPAQGLTI
ncbi:hypothetical protein ACS0TY_023427 [Phlomoides rotata]